MFKLIYRICLVSVLSGSLINLSFAQTASGSGTSNTNTSGGGIVTNADGSRQVTQETKIEGHKESPEMFASVTMIAVGLVAMKAWKYKPITTDIMIAAAGGAAFIWGEFSSTKEIEEATAKITERSDGKVDNAQVAALEKMKADLEEVRDGIKSKKTMQTTAAVAFGTAAAVAFWNAYKLDAAFVACSAALKADILTDKAAITAATAAVVAPPVAALGAAATTALPGCVMADTIYPARLTSYNAIIPESSAKAISLDQKAKAAALKQIGICTPGPGQTHKVACGEAEAIHLEQMAFTPLPVTPADVAGKPAAPGEAAPAEAAPAEVAPPAQVQCTGPGIPNGCTNIDGNYGKPFEKPAESAEYVHPFYKKLFPVQIVLETPKPTTIVEDAINLFLPKADAASMMTTLFLGVGGAGLAMISAIGVYVDNFMYAPLRRGILWTALGGMAYMASEASQKVIDDLEVRIKKLEGMIKNLKDGNGSGTSSTSSKLVANSVTPTFGKSNFGASSANATFPCSLPNCASMNANLPNTSGWSQTPDALKGLSFSSVEPYDARAGKPVVTADALGSANGVGGNAAKVQGAIKQLKDGINAQLAKRGQTPINFAKEESALLKGMNKVTADTLGRAGTTASGFLASIGATPSITTMPDPKKLEAKSFAKNGGLNLNGGGAPSAPKGFTFKDDKPAFQMGAEPANQGSLDNNYKLGKGDISTDPSASIFNVISERYLKSGYPKLLDEEPAAPPVKVPLKK